MKLFSDMQFLALEYGCQLVNENILTVGFRGLDLDKDVKPQIDSIVEELKLRGTLVNADFPETKGSSDYVKVVLKNMKAIYTISAENFQKFLEKIHQISDSIKADDMFTALDEEVEVETVPVKKVSKDVTKEKPAKKVVEEEEETVEELSADAEELEEESTEEVEEPVKPIAKTLPKKTTVGKEEAEDFILKNLSHGGAIFYDDFAKKVKGVTLDEFKKICFALCKKDPKYKYDDSQHFIYK